jgi:SagB-type dehydrogenase family enzyme
MKKLAVFLMILFSACLADAKSLEKVKLPSPELNKGKPLMEVLNSRKSTREFADTKLFLQELANLLWAANGINRNDGKRTAPSAMNCQDIDLYVVLEEGIYLYEPGNHELVPVVAGDFRKSAGMQNFVATAPLNVILVSDQAKIKSRGDDKEKMTWSDLDAGFVSENIYLYCASEGLVTVTRASIDKEALAKIMKLRSEQKIILGQTIGYPAK